MNTRPKGPEKPFWRSNYWLLLLVGLLVVLAVQSVVWPRSREELTYSRFKDEVSAGRISEGKIGVAEITGKWEKSTGTVVTFHTPSRGLEQRDPQLLPLLKEHDVAFVSVGASN